MTNPTQTRHRVDLHSHFLPDFYQQALKDNGYSNPDGMPAVPSWSPQAHLALMDRLNIQKSILSVSSPGTHIVPNDPSLARTLTRDVNVCASQLKQSYPTRFSYFASLPLPLIRETLDEIPLALSEGADGFILETNHHGVYLGDKRLDPVFDLLNARDALIFIHPTTPHLCPLSHAAGSDVDHNSTDARPTDATPLSSQYPNPMLEFFFDTARVVANLYLSGTMSRCPRIRFLLPHLGGAFAPMLSRWTTFSSLLPGEWERPFSYEEVVEDMRRRVWFDLAGVPFPNQILGLLEIFEDGRKRDAEKWKGAGRVVYGSDFPFTPDKGVEMLAGMMDHGAEKIFDAEEIDMIYYGNATALLARGERK